MKNKIISASVVVLSLYFLDVTLREMLVAAKAQKKVKLSGKPMLNVGSGTFKSSATGPKLRGDVNCDIAAPKDSLCSPGKVCYCDAQDLSRFGDKQFGVALAINVLKYVPNKKLAMKELHRVADEVITSNNVLPWPQLGPGPIFPVS